MLEAFGAALQGVMAGIYDPGTLHVPTRTDATDGSVTVTWADVAIKGQVDQVSEVMRVSAGYTAKQQRLIVLADGAATITTDCECTLGGTRWSIAAADLDTLASHWVLRGQRAA